MGNSMLKFEDYIEVIKKRENSCMESGTTWNAENQTINKRNKYK